MNIRKNNVGAYCIRPNASTIQVDVFRAYAIRPYNHVTPDCKSSVTEALCLRAFVFNFYIIHILLSRTVRDICL